MSQALKTYTEFARAGKSQRELEAGALLNAAGKLAAAQQSGDAQARDEAIGHNRRLWAVLFSAVNAPSSPLPAELRANIASLANFVFRSSLLPANDDAGDPIERLISINRDLAAGLRD